MGTLASTRNANRHDAPAWCRRLLTLAAALVPDADRADWRREWETELWYYERRLRAERSRARATVGLARRLGVATVHAAWMRHREVQRRPSVEA